jgi:uracil-DNA glycosylase
MDDIIRKIHSCALCTTLPLGANPVVQLHPDSKIVIVGQAPGKRVHETGIPWNDRSGETLRKWLGVTPEQFYDPINFSIMPMGFCYPGKGKSGDLPPRPECAKLWHPQITGLFKNKPLIILIGQYAQKYYLGKNSRKGLTDTVLHYDDYLPEYFVLPHPSPRNQYWPIKNPWFIEEVIPRLQKIVSEHLNATSFS